MSLMTRDQLDAVLGLTLTDEQWVAVSAPMEPYVIVAGAGTGKTSVMAARVLWLVASGLVEEQEVLGLTFTNKAAAELAGRISGLLARWRDREGAAVEDPGEPTVATYHSFARRLLQEQGLRIGIEPGARLLSAAAVAQLAYRVVCRAEGLVATRGAPSRVAADVIALDANLAEQTVSTTLLREHDTRVVADIDLLPKVIKDVQTIRDTAVRRRELAVLVDQVREARSRSGGLDFSDHMRLCVDLVQSSEELVAAMRATYRVILLDEYQDTSIAQRVILSTLFSGCAVTAVGDPLQAIYGWRSASVANIAAFAQHFGGSRPPLVLSVNRRSADPILAAANRVASGLRDQHPEVAELRSPQPRTGQVRAALLDTIEDERTWLAEQVAAEITRGRRPDDIAVLCRANDTMRPLRDALQTRGIPASIVGSAAITSSPYASAVLATLRLLADPADNVAAVTLLTGPRWRIGAVDLEQLGRRATELSGPDNPTIRTRPRPTEATPTLLGPDGSGAGDLPARLVQATIQPDPVERPSLLEAAAHPGVRLSMAAASRLAEFVAELAELHTHVGDPLPELVNRVVATIGAHVESELAARTESGPGAAGTAASAPDSGLRGLIELVDQFSDADGRSGLGSFLAYLNAAEQLGSGEQVALAEVPGTVRLMSMHQSKGLEFPVVVVPHLCNEVFPGKRGSDRWTTRAHVVPTELRDDRGVLPTLTGYGPADRKSYLAQCRAHDRSGDDRLAYVAFTRAEDALIASGHWWGPTQVRTRGPSDYLHDVRAESSESTDPHAAVDPWTEEPNTQGTTQPVTNPLLGLADDVVWPTPNPPDDNPVLQAAQAVTQLVASGRAVPLAELLGRPEHEPTGPGAPAHSAGAAGSADPAGPGETASSGGRHAFPVAAEIAGWDAALTALLARGTPVGDSESGVATPLTVAVPASLSASAALELAADPQAFAERLARPMPQPRSRFADLGTAFHAWVETRLGVQPLIADDELPGAADEEIASAAELAELTAAFERLEYATRTPAGLEVPFAVALAGRIVRGRIDAVFPAGPGSPAGQLWEVVDWKTSRSERADPLQLAIYRLAWAEITGAPLDSVGAAFAYVRSGNIVRPNDLPGEAELTEILGGEESAAPF